MRRRRARAGSDGLGAGGAARTAWRERGHWEVAVVLLFLAIHLHARALMRWPHLVPHHFCTSTAPLILSRKTLRASQRHLQRRQLITATCAGQSGNMIEPSQPGTRGDAEGEAVEGVELLVTRLGPKSVAIRWSIPWTFTSNKLKQKTTRCLWSSYFEVGGKDCRLLVYPAGAAPLPAGRPPAPGPGLSCWPGRSGDLECGLGVSRAAPGFSARAVRLRLGAQRPQRLRGPQRLAAAGQACAWSVLGSGESGS